MRSDRPRHDSATRDLLIFEKQFRETGTDQAAAYRKILDKLYKEVLSIPYAHSSLELDSLLQLSMLYLAARLRFDFRSTDAEFRVSTSVYNPRYDVLIIKPSRFLPGRCSVKHPTILLDPQQLEEQPKSHYIGLSGLTLLSGEVLHCEHPADCDYHVRLDSESGSALSIPLLAGFREAIDRFRHVSHAGAGKPTPHCCRHCESCQQPPPNPRNGRNGPSPEKPGSPRQAYGVLNIDCNSQALDLRQAQKWLASPQVQEILHHLVLRLTEHQVNRVAYRVLRTGTVLSQLSQHDLAPRQAYRALLGEISNICDGADVTLHLKTMFDRSDTDRSVKLVAGVGKRFRGFLIGERYGDGLVGKAIDLQEHQFLDSVQIERALRAEEPEYRRLMPGTALNAVFPVRFHSRAIGAINIEWDQQLVRSTVRRNYEDEYLNARKSMLQRLASYLALVIDYFDDKENDDLRFSGGTEEEAAAYQRSSSSRLRVLAYYVGEVLRVLEEPKPTEAWRKAVEKGEYLRDIIDAIGYFLTFENHHRILASVRKKVESPTEPSLELVYDHRLGRRASSDSTEKIPIEVGTSVLGTCAELGIPLYGCIENDLWLRPQQLCIDCAPESDKPKLKQPIRYKSAGHQPVFEVAVPLVFGGRMLGTFDFELFSVDRPAAAESATETARFKPLAIAGYQLAPFLEWSRAISFSMAFAEDALHPPEEQAGLEACHRQAYRRFRRLCAQIIANVNISPEHLISIGSEYLQDLMPIREAKLDREGVNASTSVDISEPLRWRGQNLGRINIELEPDTEPGFPGLFLSKGTSRLAKSFVASFYSAALGPDPRPFGFSKFPGLFEAVRATFREKVGALRKGDDFHERDPFGIIGAYFVALDQSLREHLLVRGHSPDSWHPGRLGWFLYMTRCVPHGEREERAVLRCGSPFARWAAMRTQEMHALLAQLRGEEDRERAFIQILGDQGREIWKEASACVPGTDAEGMFLEALAGKEREYPIPGRQHGLSLTTTTARLGIQNVADLNRSPLRSPRQREWFFRDEPYSVVAAPIFLEQEKACVGVLQIFRRRDYIDDGNFFKNYEVQAIRELVDAIQEELKQEIEWIDIPVLSPDAPQQFITRSMVDLSSEILSRISLGQSPLVVPCDFLAEEKICRYFIRNYVGESFRILTTQDLLQDKLNFDLMKKDPPVAVLYRRGSDEKIAERLRSLTGLTEPKRMVVIFIPRSKEVDMPTLLDEAYSVARQGRDAPEVILKAAFGIAAGRDNHGWKEIRILFRRGRADYSLEKLQAECGGDAGSILKSAHGVLSQLRERQGVSRRILPHWYQYGGD
jgi:hypothetical protein